MRTLADRFWSKVEKGSDSDCWLWAGCKGTRGYGQMRGRGGAKAPTVKAHRVSYEIAYGPIPEGLVIDHKCRNHGCVNPAHLEAVTQRENMVRGLLPNFVVHKSNICKRGHPLTGDNIAFCKGGKQCKICKSESLRSWKEKNRERSRATMKSWIKKNEASQKEKRHQYYLANKDRIKDLAMEKRQKTL